MERLSEWVLRTLNLKLAHHLIAAIALWSLFVFIFLYQSLNAEKLHTIELARKEGRALFNKDIAFRQWSSDRGGCYVEISDKTPPNPYLAHIQERDIVTPSGKKLTLMNPAYMLRSMFNEYSDNFGIVGKITGLKYLNPINAPDEWEKSVLHRFNQGEEEIIEITDKDGAPYLRFMSVMKMEKSCVKCHAILGYKEGDIRGGVSLSVPLQPFNLTESTHLRNIVILHLSLWIIGLALIILIYLQAKNYQQKSKELAAELLKAKERAESGSKAKGDFLAQMSHEIRTPMNSIIGFASILSETNLSESQKDLLSKIENASEVLLGVINDILDMSKIDAGKFYLAVTPFSLKTTIEQIISITHTTALQKGLAFNSKISDELPPIVHGDQLRLQQILLNLISNAIKFTSKGSVTLSLEVIKKSKSMVDINFTIVDTGIGMSEDEVRRVRSPFEQADTSISRKFGGTGLGLTIASKLVALMGGNLKIDSHKGVGSTFSFMIRAPYSDEVSPTVTPKVTHDWGTKRGRVLLVEDNEINRAVATEMLSKYVDSVESVADGEDAINLLKKDPNFDLILMDIQMPTMDGLTATKIIRQGLLIKNVPIVAMTAHVQDSDRRVAAASGMDDFLPKPVRLNSLEEILLKYIKKN